VTDVGGDGFEAGFPELFLPAFRVALRIVENVADAEDVAAEACARALRAWGRLGTLPYRNAWVVRVASNLAVDRVRRRRALPVTAAYVPDLAESITLRLALAAALRALPRRQREVVALRYLARLSEADVAGSLGISRNTVKQHSGRAVAALLVRLGAEWQEANLVLE
jgi:RNA polymerase sigma factor (sigma-70 family)